MEDLFWIPYLWTWVWVQIFAFIGLALPSFKSWGLAIRDDWDSKMVLYESDAFALYSDYQWWGAI